MNHYQNRYNDRRDAGDYGYGGERRERQAAPRRNNDWKNEPVSEGRKNLIRTILTEREVPADVRAELFAQAATMTNEQAMGWVTRLKGFDRAGNGAVAVADAPVRKDSVTITETGFYLFEDEAFKVVRTKDGQRFYAERATSSGWDYESAKGVVYRLEPEMLMTPMDIAKFGKARQFCVNCSHGLKDPISQAIGLGTQCGPDVLGKDDYKAAKEHAIATDPAAARHDAEQKAGAKARREAKKAQAVTAFSSPVDQDELLADFGVAL